MGKIIRPPKYEEISGPLIFLNGPSQRTYPWMHASINFIQKRNSGIHLAVPDRSYINNKSDLYKYCEWEEYYQSRAFQDGAIMFWFPEETNHVCEGIYACVTIINFGYWLSKLADGYDVGVSFGIDPKFTNAELIKSQMRAKGVNNRIFNSLEQTCFEAIREALRPKRIK